MISLPRFPSSEAHWNATVSDGIRPFAKPSWSGFPPPNNDDPLVGQTLNGTYVVEFVLGEGGMGRVYCAHHTRITSKRFAIKVLRQELSSNREMVARFRREAEAAACVTHPNVVAVYDVDETRSNYTYLVCEYLEGIELSEHLRNCGQLSVVTAIHIARQICSALAAAHAANVMHRDIKPQNIFVLTKDVANITERPDIKVLDFGLSRFMDAVGTQLTRDGVIMGTPAYMAPEQASGKAVDHRADIYGVGAVLYSLVTGSSPHQGETLQELLLDVLNQAPPVPRSLNPEIPSNLEWVIQKAMAREPGERYQSMLELDQALSVFDQPTANEIPSGKQGGRAIQRYAPEPDAEEVNSARPKLVALGMCALLLTLTAFSTLVPSIEQITGKLHFTKTEVALLLAGFFGTLITPLLLVFRHIQRNVWASHMRVLDGLSLMKRTLLLSLATYGLAALGARFMDDVLARFTPWRLLAVAPGASFRGWNLVFVVIALSAGGLLLVRESCSSSPEKNRQVWARYLIPFLGVVLFIAGLSWGFKWRQQVARADQRVRATLAHSSAPVVPAQTSEPVSAAPKATVAEPIPSAETIDLDVRASADELAQASAKGAAGLLPLAEKYPRDPYVLKPLILTFASRSTGLTDAMAMAQRLFEVAPDEARDSDLRYLVRRAANSPGEASTMAFSMMSERMGATGPDLLYEIFVANTKASKQADELLSGATVQSLATPALKIAYELRKAPNCAARVPLLDRAAELGDIRSVSILSPLTVAPKHGCGKWKRSPCPAACPVEAGKYLDAIMRIMARQPRH